MSHDLRVRKEDKGGRFFTVDGCVEDELLEKDLGNPIHNREINEDPMEEYKNIVQQWADENLTNGNITESMHSFVSDIRKSHPANPKPL